jgi:hypothetical protein
MASEVQLQRIFQGLCAAAATRQTGLVLAIEDGSSGAMGDRVKDVAQVLWDAATNSDAAASWSSEELTQLIPLGGDRDPSGFPYVPVMGEAPASKQGVLEPWCWALKMGYARDRVIGYARIKQAMLDASNLSASPEVQTAMFRVWGRVNSELRAHEHSLEKYERDLYEERVAPRAEPADEIQAQRAQWTAASRSAGSAHRQQPTMLRSPLVIGFTSREIDALARDTKLEREDAFSAAASSADEMGARDALLGTETFVSVVFPARDHREMHAVGAATEGVRVGDDDYRMPAMVTLHNATGAIEPICRRMGERCADNVYVTNDAAALLADLHSLIVTARLTLPKGGVPLPRDQQRNYLLLEHALL